MDFTKAGSYRSSRSDDDWLRNMRMIINSKRWDFSVIKHLISLKPSLVNVKLFNHKTLLENMVLDDRGTEEIVKFLIDHGADVSSTSGRRLFLDALRCCRNRPNIVKLLLENKVVVHNVHGGVSALSEAIFEEYNVDVLKMIIDRGVDVNHFNYVGQSPLCRALTCGREFEVVKMLLDCGASVSACKFHQTPLECIVSARTIRTRIVELLLQNGAGGGNIVIDNRERTVMHHALRDSFYEPKAMCIFIKSEINDINARDARDSTYLHEALWNPRCKLEVVKCLIEKGAKVNSVDWTGDTPLHKSLSIRPCNVDIVTYLLKKDSPVNVPNRLGETATVVAVKKRQNLSIIRLMMSSGARVNHPIWPSLSIAFNNLVMDRSIENIATLQTLLKYAFLENPRIDIGHMIAVDRNRCVDPMVWVRFWNGCLWEVKKMADGKYWNGVPFLKVLGYGDKPRLKNSYESLTDAQNNYVLLSIRDNEFPFYTEILKARLGYDFIIDTFAAIHLETKFKDDKIEKITVLTSECLEYIGRYLSRDDMLKMIFLYHEFLKIRLSTN